jgi:hypothetical protein
MLRGLVLRVQLDSTTRAFQGCANVSCGDPLVDAKAVGICWHSPQLKLGDSQFDDTCPPSEVLPCLLERSLLRGSSRVPHGTCPHPGHLTTCQVVQVDRLVLATLDP